MTRVQRTPKEDLLIGGLDDWADAGWALQSLRLLGHTDLVALRDLTIEMIGEVLLEGLMVAGDVVGGDHVVWHGDAPEWIERITREWGAEVPTPGSVVWLENTTRGDEAARAVLAREGTG